MTTPKLAPTMLQQRCLEILQRRGNSSTTELAVLVKSNRLAVSSAMRSLAAKGRVQQYVHTSYGTENQAGTQMWAIVKKDTEHD